MPNAQPEAGLKKLGTHAALIAGEIVHGIPDHSIYVASESDLASLTDLPTGAIAIQFGFKAIWQLDATGTWIKV